MSWPDLLLLFGLAAIWGASFLFIKVAVLEMSPLALASFRLTLGALGLLAILGVRGLFQGSAQNRQTDARLLSRRLWLPSLVLALFGAVFPYLLIAWGELHITSGAAAILNATSPLFSTLFGHILGLWGVEERLTLSRATGLVLGLVGVTVLVGGSEGAQVLGTTGTLELFGYAAVLVASASYAVGGLYARRAFAGLRSTTPAVGQNLFGALVLLPFALTLGRPAAWPSPAAVGAILALGLGGTAVAYLLYYRLIARVGATRTLSVTYLLPATALIYGAALLGEAVTPSMLVGLALILAGVTLTTGVLQEAGFLRN